MELMSRVVAAFVWALRTVWAGVDRMTSLRKIRRVMGVAARVRERGAAPALESCAAGRARLSREGALQIEVGECELGLPGKAEAMANLIRRTLRRTRAPIFNSFSRMVPQVASANWVWRSAIRRNSLSST